MEDAAPPPPPPKKKPGKKLKATAPPPAAGASPPAERGTERATERGTERATERGTERGNRARRTAGDGRHRMELRTVAVDRLKPAPYNPRKALKPGDPEWVKIRDSLNEHGYVTPVVWNERTGHLVGGHQRVQVMLAEWGVSELAVSVVNLNDTDERLLNARLNKVGGAWDDEKLRLFMLELDELGVERGRTGFDDDELDTLMAERDLTAVPDDEPDPAPQLEGLEYRVIVTCDDEEQQRELIGRWSDEGLSVEALIS